MCQCWSKQRSCCTEICVHGACAGACLTGASANDAEIECMPLHRARGIHDAYKLSEAIVRFQYALSFTSIGLCSCIAAGHAFRQRLEYVLNETHDDRPSP